MKILLMLFASFFSIYGQAQQPKLDKKGNLISMDDVEIFSMVKPVPSSNIFSDEAYNIWCGSVVKGGNGKFYMFYSRWPQKNGVQAWVSESEIALAVSDKPGGPYKHLKVILPARGNQYWDGACTHNPAAIMYKGKCYLYYMGNTGTPPLTNPTGKVNDWWVHRNNQRIGVAVADNPEGKWKRFDKPVLDGSIDSTAIDALMVSNPAITIDQNGRAILVYKAVGKNGTTKGGRVRFAVAFSKSPLGPFTKHNKPIFEIEGKEDSWMVAEDPYLWTYNGVNYAIVRDVVGYYTNKTSALALLQSTNGINWKTAKYPKVVPKKIQFADGTTSIEAIQRPCLYVEKGVPIVLFGGLANGKTNNWHSVNVAIPLK